jgi:hypothetical protein
MHPSQYDLSKNRQISFGGMHDERLYKQQYFLPSYERMPNVIQPYARGISGLMHGLDSMSELGTFGIQSDLTGHYY